MRCIVFLVIALSLCVRPCLAGDALLESRLRHAVSDGVKWMVSKQKADGSFEVVDNGMLVNQFHGAFAALAVLALHDAGHRASDASDEGRALLKAIGYLCHDVAATHETLPGSYLGRADRSRMYGHGMMTYALATVVEEVADFNLQADVRVRVLEAVAYIRASQQVKKLPGHAGGWRYEGVSMDSDMSVSVWQLLALRAAVDHARATMPEFMWTQAADYVKHSTEAARTRPGHAGGISYQPGASGDHFTFATTGAGVVALQCCAQADAPEAKAGRLYIDQCKLTADKPYFFWGVNHCSHAMLAAEEGQKTRFLARLADVLVPAQKADGSWHVQNDKEKQIGDLFATAMAVSAMGPWAGKK